MELLLFFSFDAAGCGDDHVPQNQRDAPSSMNFSPLPLLLLLSSPLSLLFLTVVSELNSPHLSLLPILWCIIIRTIT